VNLGVPISFYLQEFGGSGCHMNSTRRMPVETVKHSEGDSNKRVIVINVQVRSQSMVHSVHTPTQGTAYLPVLLEVSGF
jgi:hypothetical protein